MSLKQRTMSAAIICFFMSLPCAAQELAPAIRLSPAETTKAKQLGLAVVDARERSRKAATAWDQFHRTYQVAHAELPNLRFTQDFQLAFAEVQSTPSEVRYAGTVELTAEEHKKLEALRQEMIESERSQKDAVKNWREFEWQLVVDHVGASSTEGGIVTLAGKQVLIPHPWEGGLFFTSDFRLAFPVF